MSATMSDKQIKIAHFAGFFDTLVLVGKTDKKHLKMSSTNLKHLK